MKPSDFVAADGFDAIEESLLAELEWRHEQHHREHLGLIDNVDPEDLSESGWGVIFPERVAPAVREALTPLVSHRSQQSGALYRELTYKGESKLRFLAQNGSAPGAVDPRRIPYYLLIVGSPSEIPFRFQYDLGVNHAVGRLHFGRPEDYACYARGVITAEGIRLDSRKASVFGVRNGDPATDQIHHHLVVPLARSLRHEFPKEEWDISRVAGRSTKKVPLRKYMGGSRTPSLLFGAAHGVSYPLGDQRQRAEQGALLCKDWPGPRKSSSGLLPEWYLAGHDVPDSGRLGGRIIFLFACYSAGTPEFNNFAFRHGDERGIISSTGPFVAALPRRLLSHSGGSALAVVGHVDRIWSYSFYWPLAEEQLQVFEQSLGRLMRRMPLGYAMEPFSQRYADLATELADSPLPGTSSSEPDFLRYAALRTALLDARNYVILGDPAVRF